MKPLDFAKAFGLGLLLMVLNLALLFGLGFLYDTLINPGRTAAFYQTVYPKLGVWSAPIGAITMLFLTAWLFGARRPARNPYLFGAAVFVSYIAIDTALGLASGPLSALLIPPFLIAVGGGAVAALAGAYVSQAK